jgi:hypothetical protein
MKSYNTEYNKRPTEYSITSKQPVIANQYWPKVLVPPSLERSIGNIHLPRDKRLSPLKNQTTLIVGIFSTLYYE